MIYRCGQKVICINDSNWSENSMMNQTILPIKGRVYTIREIYPSYKIVFGTAFLLYEIVNKKYDHFFGYAGQMVEPGFLAERFRPVVDESKTNIEVFRKMLDQPNREQV